MNRAVIMFVAVMSTIGAAALVVAGPEGVNRLEEQRRNLGRLEVRRDAAKRKALALEHKIAQQSEGLEGDSLFSPHREKLVRQELGVIAEDELEIELK
ncbi:MAG: hypothetical protein VYB65_10400 [Myxococcota bacterium]|jgi:hypothetical protein|nr:hypothetical protein [Myxococcota bacterium]